MDWSWDQSHCNYKALEEACGRGRRALRLNALSQRSLAAAHEQCRRLTGGDFPVSSTQSNSLALSMAPDKPARPNSHLACRGAGVLRAGCTREGGQAQLQWHHPHRVVSDQIRVQVTLRREQAAAVARQTCAGGCRESSRQGHAACRASKLPLDARSPSVGTRCRGRLQGLEGGREALVSGLRAETSAPQVQPAANARLPQTAQKPPHRGIRSRRPPTGCHERKSRSTAQEGGEDLPGDGLCCNAAGTLLLPSAARSPRLAGLRGRSSRQGPGFPAGEHRSGDNAMGRVGDASTSTTNPKLDRGPRPPGALLPAIQLLIGSPEAGFWPGRKPPVPEGLQRCTYEQPC